MKKRLMIRSRISLYEVSMNIMTSSQVEDVEDENVLPLIGLFQPFLAAMRVTW